MQTTKGIHLLCSTDGDGEKDIVVNRTGSGDENHRFYQGYYLQLVEQVGARRFEDKTTQLLFKNEDINADWITWIHMCDCNGDGQVDIVADDDVGRIIIWENDGTGAFRPRYARQTTSRVCEPYFYWRDDSLTRNLL